MFGINVSKNGQHLFAVARRSTGSVLALKNVVGELREKFKEKDGFKISVSQYTEYSEGVTDKEVTEIIACFDKES